MALGVRDESMPSSTKQIQDEFFDYINGEKEDKYKWLTYVN